jgi:type I restriction enzyme S subunit
MVKPGYKQTEVGVIPEDWDAVSLSQVCSMKSGEGITSANIDDYSEYPCYGGNGLRGYTSRYTHDGDYALIGRQGALCGNVGTIRNFVCGSGWLCWFLCLS